MSVICISGAPGSGKTTVATALASKMGMQFGSFGDYVRARAREEGQGSDRVSLQRFGQALVDKGARNFCIATLKWIGWRSPDGLILDGLRHISVHDALKALVAPIDVRLVFIDIDQGIQRSRLFARGGEVPEEVMTDATEREVSLLRERADLTVDAATALESILLIIKKWLGEP